MVDWSDVLGKVVIPALVGGVAGWFSPWINWHIEQRRQILSARRELVTSWRRELLPLIKTTDGWTEQEGRELFASPHYHSLRGHLDPDVMRRLEMKRHVAVGLNVRRLLGDEIARIEKQWKLI